MQILHSHYWRSPHFTFEYEYFLLIAPNVSFQAELTKSGKLLDGGSYNQEQEAEATVFFGKKADWFLPKPLKNYHILDREGGFENFKGFIDRETAEIFLTDFSV